ncbi:MAG: hypothetical protein QXI78_06905 [Archaeoglobaceae archaeon]
MSFEVRELKKLIEKELKRYKQRTIRIGEKEYPLYVFLENEDLNLFDGFLVSEIKDKKERSYLLTKYRAPVSGYAPRIGLFFYEDQLIIKDYRRYRLIRKTIRKINNSFISKLKKALSEPNEASFNKLFDRSDIIEEFYILYKKAREYLLSNIKGISEEERREEFVDNFMMQMLTLWYLQERGFFNNDTSYLITKFKELKQKKLDNGFNSYYEFLTYFFEKISGYSDSQYYEDDILGKVVVVGPAIFLNGEHDSKAITIPDKCFYKEGLTEYLINTPPKKVSEDVPILNLLESRDWTEGNIDEFVLGAIYEKLITYMERKKLGAYYTPEEITSYICKNTIEPHLIDRVNEKFSENFESVDHIIESGKKEILLYLFEQLKEIKICDPAVGSAHFLESAINVLVDIYEKLWKKAKEIGLRGGLEIFASDEKGEIKTINLVELSDEELFKLYVKFFIILSKNIYGVDINPSALKVAKARLFLTLAKHFNADDQRKYFIRFPNVHFNLREGNSLIGYVHVERERGQLSLTMFEEEDGATYIQETVKVVSELKDYLNKIARILGIDGDVVRELEGFNRILSKKEIRWSDFEAVLRTKEKLIRILIASLNSQYAKPLNELLNLITALFNQKLDERFASEHNIDLAELKKIKTFHWIFEFPEVFLDRGGFDIVVGNPPHGAEISDTEIILWDKLYTLKERGFDSAKCFLERSLSLLRSNSPLSFVIPKASTYSYSWEDLRTLALRIGLSHCIDLGKAFENVKHEQILLILWKKNVRASQYRGGYFSKRQNKIIETGDIPVGLTREYGILASNLSPLEISIGNYLLRSDFEKMTSFDVFRGLPIKFQANDGEWCYKGKDIGRYYGLPSNKVVIGNTSKERVERLRKEKVIAQNIVAHVVNPYERIIIMAMADTIGFLTFETVTNIVPPKNFPVKSLSVILNSRFVSWFTYVFIYNKAVRDMHFDEYFVKRILLPKSKDYALLVLARIGEYLHFSNATEERRTELREIIEFLDCRITDSLVYELYFKEKFHEDGLYPEPKEYLLELVSKLLKPINYDRWAELYRKKQLEGKLTDSEEKELERLEKENLRTVESVYNALIHDKQIQEVIKKIKAHPWIRVIEGET